MKTVYGLRYQLLVNNEKAWVCDKGSWEMAESPMLGIAKISGFSADAASYVPSAFFHGELDSLSAFEHSPLTVTTEKIAGRLTYLVKYNQMYTMSFWIDAKTFFLVQTRRVVEDYPTVVKYGTPKVDLPIPASRFVK